MPHINGVPHMNNMNGKPHMNGVPHMNRVNEAPHMNGVNGVPHLNGVNKDISYCNTSMLQRLRKFCCVNWFI